MNGDFFVMLNTQQGGVTPMTCADTDDLATFETEEAARQAADTCVLGHAFGYEVFERGGGV